MWRAACVITMLLVLLLSVTPVVWASTAETWTDGIYDYESDDAPPAVAHDHVATLHLAPIVRFGNALAVVGRLLFSDRAPAVDVVPSASHPRGPPLA